MAGGDRSPSGASETDNTRDAEPRRNPKPDNEQSPPLKRRAPSPGDAEEDPTSKRVRLDDGATPPSPSASNGKAGTADGGDEKASGDGRVEVEQRERESLDRDRDVPRRPSGPEPDRRNRNLQEERKRGQRLFGGLLSTLSQTTANSHQKKRLEIERRQQERAHQQKAEDDKRRAERLAKLDRVRKIEQVDFDERVMHTRHKNVLSAAHSLHTTSTPKLYYRPWDLTEEQERIVKRQVQKAEDTVEQEVKDFQRSKERRLRDLGVSVAPTQSNSKAGEPTLEPSNPPQAAPASRPTSSRYGHERDHDELVENEEDTLIY